MGREAALDALVTALAAARPAAVIAVLGVGGVGKSVLAEAACRRLRPRFRAVRWVRAASTTELVGGLSAAGREQDLCDPDDDDASAALALREHLETVPGWLLVLDDAADPRTLAPWLPSRGGPILVTSRHSGWRDRARCVLELDALDDGAAAALLSGLTGEDGRRVTAAARAVGGLPLALRVAAPLVAEHAGACLEPGADPLAGAVRAAAARVRSRSPRAWNLLDLTSLLGSAPIPEPLLEALARALARAGPGEPDPAGRLLRAALAESVPGGLRVPDPVQRAVRGSLAPARRRALLDVLVGLLLEVYRNSSAPTDPEFRATATRAVPHALAVAHHAVAPPGVDRRAVASAPTARDALILLTLVASHQQHELGLAGEAARTLAGALGAASLRFGPRSQPVATLAHELAPALVDAGRPDEAEQRARQALELYEELAGPASPEVAATLVTLGTIRAGRGDLRGALGLMLRATDLARRAGRTEELAFRLHHLAGVLAELGDPAAAVAAAGEALKVKEAAFGRRSAPYAGTLRLLGRIHRRDDDPAAARVAHEEALDIAVDVFGEGDRRTAVYLADLASSCLAEGDVATATGLLTRYRAAVGGDAGPVPVRSGGGRARSAG